MLRHSSFGLIALSLAMMAGGGAYAQDESKYPDWSGSWSRMQNGSFDGSSQSGPTEKPPLTPEYKARWDASLEAQLRGDLSGNPVERCLPPGMPRTMVVIDPMEIVITAKTTYIMVSYMAELRRIYTDGRSWPAQDAIQPTFSGYSLGRWEDSEGKGRYDTLYVETRFLKGPRSYGTSGIPFHDDNETVVKERISLDKNNPAVLLNVITVEDHALAEPWVVTRKYRNNKNPKWTEYVCTETNQWVAIGDQFYYVGADGLLMPSAKGQPGPDLRHFPQPAK
jgi:hypothetical protein